MRHELTTSLLWFGYYMALAVWLLLILLLITGALRKRWDIVKRGSKFLINSSVFVLAYSFYIDMAVIVRPPGSEPLLRKWVNQHVTNYLYISVIAAIILLAVNLLFYKRIEKYRHKADVFILTLLDIIVMFSGAWLSGENAYYGLLQELNR
jgi:hypothetical protein